MDAQTVPQLSLDFVGEPTLVLDTLGTVLLANAAARTELGPCLVGRPVGALFDEPAARLQALLVDAAAATVPRMTALLVAAGHDPGGTSERRQVRLARLTRDPGAPPLVALSLAAETEGRFRRLHDTVSRLQAVLRERQAEKAELHAALEQNTLLYRELQHRLKNNIHLIGALLRMSARDHDTAEVRAVLDAAMIRIQAMGRTQEAIYEAKSLGEVEAGAFVERILRGISASLMAQGRIDCQVQPLRLRADAAHNLALIVNELATNALKYGRQDAAALLRVRMSRAGGGDMLDLSVADNGPGFDPASVPRSSGLALVEALVEQLGGTLHLTTPPEGGSDWQIALPADLCQPEDAAPASQG